jgi:HAD superfamily hydrolase (TIGR01450 family)
MKAIDTSIIRHVALDLDGTIYRGGTLFDFTLGFLARLDALGIGHTFLTNNSSKSRADYVQHLGRMGIGATADQLQTSTLVTIEHLRAEHPGARRLYVLGTPSLAREFAESGFDVVTEDPDDAEPDVVVVGFDTGLTFQRLCKAAWWIGQGKPFVATHPDRVCPTDEPTILVDCGAVCACLTSATGVQPHAVLGKPDPRMLTGILHRHGLEARELAMVGDRLYTDMVMARRTGALSVLVLTGEATAEAVARCPTPPDIVVPSLKEFGAMLGRRQPRGAR